MSRFEIAMLKDIFEVFSLGDGSGLTLFDCMNAPARTITKKICDENVPNEIRLLYCDLAKSYISAVKSYVTSFEVLRKDPIGGWLANSGIIDSEEIKLLDRKKNRIRGQVNALQKTLSHKPRIIRKRRVQSSSFSWEKVSKKTSEDAVKILKEAAELSERLAKKN